MRLDVCGRDGQPPDPVIVEGVENIAALMNLPKRRAYYLCETGAIPAFKLQGKWCIRPATLDAFFRNLEGAAAPAFGDKGEG